MNLQKRVRARKDEEDSDELELPESESEFESVSGTEAGSSDAGDGNLEDTAEPQSGNDGSNSAPSEVDPREVLSSISFGALASAQASLSAKRAHGDDALSSRKRQRSASPFHEASERQAGKATGHKPPPSRSSKHAPTELSAKRAVSRKRDVVATPSKQSARDPRFSALSGELDLQRVEKNYGFLREYRASEMAELKARIRDARDARARERLRRELMVMEDQEKARKRDEQRQAVLQEHRKGEREKVKAGKTPFFLKRAEVKKQVREKRFEGMGKWRAAKALEKQRKREAGKEKKSLPRVRRSAVEAGGVE